MLTKCDDVSSHISHMHVRFFSPRDARFSTHILSENLAQRDASNEKGTHISVRGTNAIVLCKLNARTDSNRLLTSSDVHSAYDLALPIKLSLDTGFQLPRQLHVVQHVQESFLIEIHSLELLEKNRARKR
jgi:hypothetical protein